MKKVIEIENYNGSTIMSFIVDCNGEEFNITNMNDCSVADTDGDYIYNTEYELIRVQSEVYINND